LGWVEISYGATEGEKKSLVFRRSLYIAEDMQAGDVLTTQNLRIVRPGYGLAPKHIDLLLGKNVCRAVKRGTPVSWEIF
ncbi:MAG: pseudaminic acid synthase, partial [Candidatus Electrothrix sp. AS4_5]|nr:pseudaminic acid synthase [Candidatus Electrothrix gigas]